MHNKRLLENQVPIRALKGYRFQILLNNITLLIPVSSEIYVFCEISGHL